MSDWHRPPPDISAAEFFSTWLPAAYAAAGCRALPSAPLVRVSLSGAAGGHWDLLLEGNQIVAQPLPGSVPRDAPVPEVWIRQATDDFLAAFREDPDLPALLPPRWSALDLLFLDPRDGDLLRQISGRLLVEIAGRRRRRWALDVALGKAGMAAGRPRATVRLDGATYAGLAGGSVPPLQAFLQGKVQVEGDRALAMQALLLIGARLSRT
jgi:hypothetical protein